MGKMNNLKKKRLMRRNMVGYSFIAPNYWVCGIYHDANVIFIWT